MYTVEQSERLHEDLNKNLERSLDLAFRVTFRDYSSERGREFAVHGFSRRIRTLDHCLSELFAVLPPMSSGLPNRHAVQTATAFLQTLVINTYGAFDNLAHVWVAERHLQGTDGTALDRKSIGFAPKYKLVRSSLPEPLLRLLRSYDEWFAYLEDYRHALAHRIPLYIADRAYREADLDALADVRRRKEEAYDCRDYAALEQLLDEEDALGVFNPLMVHSYGEKAQPMYFHSQALCDHATVTEFADAFFEVLNS